MSATIHNIATKVLQCQCIVRPTPVTRIGSWFPKPLSQLRNKSPELTSSPLKNLLTFDRQRRLTQELTFYSAHVELLPPTLFICRLLYVPDQDDQREDESKPLQRDSRMLFPFFSVADDCWLAVCSCHLHGVHHLYARCPLLWFWLEATPNWTWHCIACGCVVRCPVWAQRTYSGS